MVRIGSTIHRFFGTSLLILRQDIHFSLLPTNLPFMRPHVAQVSYQGLEAAGLDPQQSSVRLNRNLVQTEARSRFRMSRVQLAAEIIGHGGPAHAVWPDPRVERLRVQALPALNRTQGSEDPLNRNRSVLGGPMKALHRAFSREDKDSTSPGRVVNHRAYSFRELFPNPQSIFHQESTM